MANAWSREWSFQGARPGGGRQDPAHFPLAGTGDRVPCLHWGRKCVQGRWCWERSGSGSPGTLSSPRTHAQAHVLKYAPSDLHTRVCTSPEKMKLTGRSPTRFTRGDQGESQAPGFSRCPFDLVPLPPQPLGSLHLESSHVPSLISLSASQASTQPNTLASLKIRLLYNLNLIKGGRIKRAFLWLCSLSFPLCTCRRSHSPVCGSAEKSENGIVIRSWRSWPSHPRTSTHSQSCKLVATVSPDCLETCFQKVLITFSW